MNLDSDCHDMWGLWIVTTCDASEVDDRIEQRAISLKVNLDRKDNPIFTKSGYLISGIIKSAGFGGERNYLKLDLNIQR